MSFRTHIYQNIHMYIRYLIYIDCVHIEADIDIEARDDDDLRS